jgi:hypothetical protein
MVAMTVVLGSVMSMVLAGVALASVALAHELPGYRG